jgi:hypothetical protein
VLNLIMLAASAPLAYLSAAFRRDLPLTRWLDRMPAPHWPHPHLRMPRLRARGMHHAGSLGLVFDADQGRYRHAETGPIPVIKAGAHAGR